MFLGDGFGTERSSFDLRSSAGGAGAGAGAGAGSGPAAAITALRQLCVGAQNLGLTLEGPVELLPIDLLLMEFKGNVNTIPQPLRGAPMRRRLRLPSLWLECGTLIKLINKTIEQGGWLREVRIWDRGEYVEVLITEILQILK